MVDQAWALPTPAVSTTAAVYLRIRTPDDDVLTGAVVDPSVAAAASFHESQHTTPDPASPANGTAPPSMRDHDMNTQDMISMTPAASYPISADSSLEFEPGVRHIMLEELAAPLDEPGSFELTLVFQQAGEITVTVTITSDPDG